MTTSTVPANLANKDFQTSNVEHWVSRYVTGEFTAHEVIRHCSAPIGVNAVFSLASDRIQALHRLSSIRNIADKQNTLESGREMLHDLLRGSLAEMNLQRDPERRARKAIDCIHVIVSAAGTETPGFPHHGEFVICADSDYVAELITGVDFKAVFAGSAEFASERNNLFDVVKQCIRRAHVPRDAAQAITKSLITAGAISLADVPKTILTASVVADALRRNPKRLSEIQDADVSWKLAMQLDIPIGTRTTESKSPGAQTDADAGFSSPPLTPEATDSPRGRVRRNRP